MALATRYSYRQKSCRSIRWVQHYAPLMEKRVRWYQRYTDASWRMDETYVKVAGQWAYLYRALDKNGDLI
jgi:IS6 family transposase